MVLMSAANKAVGSWRCEECGASRRPASQNDPSVCVLCAGEVPDPNAPPPLMRSFRGAYDTPFEPVPGQGGALTEEWHEQRAREAEKWRGR